MPWAEVPGGAKVVLSSGRVVRVLERIPGVTHLVNLRNEHGDTRALVVDPGAVVPVIFDEEFAAYASLKTRFGHVEYKGSF
ncbi:MAG TPA: hypothetical protein VFY84_19295 [Jiangellales bacterium]|nr:hypothetical protein [Jiangellales bacterium]